MRSDRATIRATTRRLTRNQPKAEPIVPGRRFTTKLTALQRRQKDESKYRDLSDCVRHLTYHMFPVRDSAAVDWNIDQLRRRWHLFNGQKIIGINYDSQTITPDDLLSKFHSHGMNWDHVIVRPNSGLGEVLTWVPTLEILQPESACENEVVFSAHAKGVKYGKATPHIVRIWTEVMYAVNLDQWQRVQRSLEWFVATGAFRARGVRFAQCKYAWYFSGAFWWWRLADIGRGPWREVGQIYPGREVWIGNQIRRDEADCLFMDHSRSPYRPEFWKAIVSPRWKKYQQEMMQNAQ